MAFHSIDAQGNIIMTDILVSGYIRQDIEPRTNQNIPPELYGSCFEACDTWCNKYTVADMIEINND